MFTCVMRELAKDMRAIFLHIFPNAQLEKEMGASNLISLNKIYF